MRNPRPRVLVTTKNYCSVVFTMLCICGVCRDENRCDVYRMDFLLNTFLRDRATSVESVDEMAASCVDEYHIVDNLAFWMRMKVDETKIVHMKIAGSTEVLFDTKNCKKKGVNHVYILADVIPVLHKIRKFIQKNNITYQPSGVVEYVFSLESFTRSKEPLIKYRLPASKEIAEQVWGFNFHFDDKLELTFNDDEIIYFYLSALVTLDHPLFNELLTCFSKKGLFIWSTDTTTSIPNISVREMDSIKFITQTTRTDDIEMAHLYTEILFFLFLVTTPEEPILLKDKVCEIAKNVCKKLNVRAPIRHLTRGRSWKIINHFFNVNPEFRNTLVELVIDPPDHIGKKMTQGDCVVLNELKRLWQWYKLTDFHDCLMFATSEAKTKAHSLPQIKKETEILLKLHAKLSSEARNLKFVPYTGFFESKEYLSHFNVKRFPYLMYAAKKKTSKDDEIKAKNWMKLVASLPAHFERQTLDENLDTPIPDDEDEITGEYEVVGRYIRPDKLE